MLRLLFPEKCPLCGRVRQGKARGFCPSCRSRLPMVREPCCKHCGKPIASTEQELCLDCSGKDSVLEQGTALWVYTDEMKRAMADFKYAGCVADGESYAAEFAVRRGELLSRWKPDCIVPVPLHWRKKWFRGFNQSACLAEELGRQCGIPVFPDALRRVRYTRPQKGLDDRQRRDNVRCAFAMHPRWQQRFSAFQRVLVVDDIYTTGSTLETCGSVLREAGVEKVYFACLCIGSDD